MMANKRQILIGVANYIEKDMISSISDTPLKVALGAVSYRLRNSPDTFDSLVFDNMAAKLLLVADSDGVYDLDNSLGSVLYAMRTYGNLSMTLNPIPLISKCEKVLTFTPGDIEKLKSRIEGCNI